MRGQQVYYMPLGESAKEERQKPSVTRATMDLIPLIIPPVANKTSLYDLQLVKTLWNAFCSATKDANEIYCVGYSLPKSDLTMRLFFSTLINRNGKTVYIANLKDEYSDYLVRNYEEALLLDHCTVDSGICCKLDTRYLDCNPIEKMVNDLELPGE